MFNKNLGAFAPFISDVANEFFATINGDQFSGDWSFLATLRALLFRRMPEGERVDLHILTREYSQDDIEAANPENVFNALFDRSPGNALTLVDFRGTTEAVNALFKVLDDKENGYAKFSGAEEQQDLEGAVAGIMKFRFYVNRQTKGSVIVVDNMDMRKYHLVQAFTVRAFRWYFEGAQNALTEIEQKLIKSLRERYAPSYENAIAEIGSTFDLRQIAIKMLLTKFEKHAHDRELEVVEAAIKETRRAITGNEQQYAKLINDLEEQNIRLMGIRQIIENAGEHSELIDYFQHNKYISPIEAYGTTLTIITKGFLELFDEDMFDKYAHHFYEYTNGINNRTFLESKENRKMFIKEIFSNDPRFRVKLCGVFAINTKGSVESFRDYHYPDDCDDYLPNPHLQIFACLGNNRPNIQNALREGNMIGAIEQCLASTKAVNLTEMTQTIQPFIRWIFNSCKKIIRLNDGRDVTPVEALEWLKEQNKTKEDAK